MLLLRFFVFRDELQSVPRLSSAGQAGQGHKQIAEGKCPTSTSFRCNSLLLA